jgi:hypothetical protein
MSMYPIATYTSVSGGPFFVDFLNIPDIYEDLHIRYTTRDSQSFSTRGMFLEINGNLVTGNGQHRITTATNGNSVGISNTLSTGRFDWSDIPGNTAVSNVFSTGIIDVSNYSNTSQLKTIQLKGGYVDGSDIGMLYHGAMLWNSTAAINSIRIYSNENLVLGSSISLYGITRNG